MSKETKVTPAAAVAPAHAEGAEARAATPDPTLQDVAHAKATAKRTGKVTRNLTQEALEGFFEQRKAEAELMEKPPKELMGLDPKKRAAQMVGG